MKTIQKQHSEIDNVVKYILEDTEFGKNEISVIRKDTKNVIVLPSQTNCKMGCKFCHLTGTTRPAINLSSHWFTNVIDFIRIEEKLNDKPLLISFMGAGEPLLNYENVLLTIRNLSEQNIKFALATMFPSVSYFDKLRNFIRANPEISLKIHLSVHGMNSRSKIINSTISSLKSIKAIQKYNEVTGNPIEYHYTMVDGINDSIEELTEFKECVVGNARTVKLDNITVKFLALSEVEECKKSKRTKEEILKIFEGFTVEFYDPPGRDVGSSCGMFDRSLYMKEEDNVCL